MDHEHAGTVPHRRSGAEDRARLARSIDEQFADVLRRLDDLAGRTDRRFAALEARAAELSVRFGSRAARILADLPPRPAMPSVPPRPACPPRPAYPPPTHPAPAASAASSGSVGRDTANPCET